MWNELCLRCCRALLLGEEVDKWSIIDQLRQIIGTGTADGADHRVSPLGAIAVSAACPNNVHGKKPDCVREGLRHHPFVKDAAGLMCRPVVPDSFGRERSVRRTLIDTMECSLGRTLPANMLEARGPRPWRTCADCEAAVQDAQDVQGMQRRKCKMLLWASSPSLHRR